jgi:polyhydroxybutyrate depolymerase
MCKTRSNVLSLVFGALLVCLLSGCVASQAGTQDGQSAAARPGDYERSMTFGERERTCLLHLPPAYDGQNALPLVIALHGGGGNAQGAAEMTGMSAKADEEGFIVVYPEGTGRLKDRLLTWNAGNCCGYALDNKEDDVAFVQALIARLQQELKIDPRRVYATGISNGGMMAYRLGCELSDKIAAIAPVAGALNNEECRPTQPVSVVIFHGTADEHVLYEGGKPEKKADPQDRVDKPVSYAVSFWVEHDRCPAIARKEEKGNVVRETYSGCQDGTEVILYTVKGGGHAWPGGGQGWLFGDEPTKEISATDVMWEFFRTHPKHD